MNDDERARAVAAVTSIASRCNLTVDAVSVVHNSNKLALHLSPADCFARVAHVGREVAEFEVDLAQQLAKSGRSPVAALDPRVEPLVYREEGFAITLWTYYSPQDHPNISPTDFAGALKWLHSAMLKVDVVAPHFTDRVAEAQELVKRPDLTPDMTDADRELVAGTLENMRRSIEERGAAEQLLHGEPHPGNVLATADGPRFIDLETVCRGPVEFDLAHVPERVSNQYPNVDQALLGDCRTLVLAMVAAWRWDRHDEFPNGVGARHKLMKALGNGPPSPSLDVAMLD